MSLKKILIIIIQVTILIFVVNGCVNNNFDFSSVENIEIRTIEKEEMLIFPFYDEGKPIIIKLNSSELRSKFKVKDTQEMKNNINKRGYLFAEFNNINLSKDENVIIVEFNGNEFPVKMNKNNINNGILTIHANIEKIKLKEDVLNFGKYKIVGFK